MSSPFDSREFFTWSESLDGYEIDEDRSGSVLPAAPDTSYRFLNDVQRIPALSLARLQVVLGKWIPWWIGPGKRTIGSLLGWCSDNMLHAGGGDTVKDMQDAWQYRGWTPVVRIISGTHNHAFPVESLNFSHWSGGCYCTLGFLRAVLRVVNISGPVHDTGRPRTAVLHDRRELSQPR